jgi:hypothetical protein
MILSLEQETQLARVERADIAWREAKRTAVARAMVAAEADIALAALVRVQEAGKARDLGIPQRTIGVLGLSTKDPKTVRAVLALSLPGEILEAEPVEFTVRTSGPVFARNEDGTITLRLVGETYSAAAREHGWGANDLGFEGANSWLLDAEGYSIEETDFIPALGKRHPVGAWHAANLRIARDWAANN